MTQIRVGNRKKIKTLSNKDEDMSDDDGVAEVKVTRTLI